LNRQLSIFIASQSSPPFPEPSVVVDKWQVHASLAVC
jgi:hypothetical protein